MVAEMWWVHGHGGNGERSKRDLAQTFGNLRAMKPLETYSLENEAHNESESLC